MLRPGKEYLTTEILVKIRYYFAGKTTVQFLKRAHNLFSLMDYMINNGILIHRAMSSTSMPRGGGGIAGDDDDDVSLNPRILSCHDNNRPPSCFDYWNKA